MVSSCDDYALRIAEQRKVIEMLKKENAELQRSRYQIAREVMKEYDQDLPNIIWHEQVDTEFLYDWLDQKEER